MPSLTVYGQAPTPASEDVDLPSTFPDVPDSILQRFGDDAQEWNDNLQQWWNETSNALTDSTSSVAAATNTVYVNTQNLSAQQGILSAAIVTESIARIEGDEALASQIITISALASSSSHISVQSTAPVSPTLNDLWVDNSSITAPITYYWDGVAWVLQTTPIVAAALAEEATARATADDNLSVNYSITAVAGNVVTGMQINSLTGSGSPISSVIFSTAAFQIWDNSATAYEIFDATAGVVTIAGTLVVNTSGKVYIGTGTYDNSNTDFYVDSTGKFSLGNKLSWSGSVLTVSGSIILSAATSPSGAGLYIGSDHLGYYNGASWMTYMDSSGDFALGGSGGTLVWTAGAGTLVIQGSATFSGVVDIGSGSNITQINSTGFYHGNPSSGPYVFLGVNSGVEASLQFFNTSAARTIYLQQTTSTRQDFIMEGNAGTGTIAMTAGSGAGEPVIVLSDGTGAGSIAPGIVNCYAASWTGNTSGHWLAGGNVVFQDGSSSSPSLTFFSDATTGLFWYTTGELGIAGEVWMYAPASAHLYDIVIRRTRGGGSNNTGIIFQNDFWGTAQYGMAGILAVDSASSGGELHLQVTANGGGSTGMPVDALVILNDGTIKFGGYTSDSGATINGYIPIQDLAGNVRNLACVTP